MNNRQTGLTSRQMLDAPAGAVFVWCNSNLGYPKALAVAVGREDLDVRPLTWMEMRNVAARKVTGLVIDHAAALSGKGYEALMYVRERGVQESVKPA